MAIKKNWFLFLDFLVKRCAVVANLCFIWYKSKTWTMYILYLATTKKIRQYGSERKILFGIASILKKLVLIFTKQVRTYVVGRRLYTNISKRFLSIKGFNRKYVQKQYCSKNGVQFCPTQDQVVLGNFNCANQ